MSKTTAITVSFEYDAQHYQTNLESHYEKLLMLSLASQNMPILEGTFVSADTILGFSDLNFRAKEADDRDDLIDQSEKALDNASFLAVSIIRGSEADVAAVFIRDQKTNDHLEFLIAKNKVTAEDREMIGSLSKVFEIQKNSTFSKRYPDENKLHIAYAGILLRHAKEKMQSRIEPICTPGTSGDISLGRLSRTLHYQSSTIKNYIGEKVKKVVAGSTNRGDKSLWKLVNVTEGRIRDSHYYDVLVRWLGLIHVGLERSGLSYRGNRTSPSPQAFSLALATADLLRTSEGFDVLLSHVNPSCEKLMTAMNAEVPQGLINNQPHNKPLRWALTLKAALAKFAEYHRGVSRLYRGLTECSPHIRSLTYKIIDAMPLTAPSQAKITFSSPGAVYDWKRDARASENLAVKASAKGASFRKPGLAATQTSLEARFSQSGLIASAVNDLTESLALKGTTVTNIRYTYPNPQDNRNRENSASSSEVPPQERVPLNPGWYKIIQESYRKHTQEDFPAPKGFIMTKYPELRNWPESKALTKHAEIQLILALEAQSIKGGQIGISKRCCGMCTGLIDWRNQRGCSWSVEGYHRKFYFCALPGTKEWDAEAIRIVDKAFSLFIHQLANVAEDRIVKANAATDREVDDSVMDVLKQAMRDLDFY